MVPVWELKSSNPGYDDIEIHITSENILTINTPMDRAKLSIEDLDQLIPALQTARWKMMGDMTKRILTTHIVEGDSVNHQLEVASLDAIGSGGAHHLYCIEYLDPDGQLMDWPLSFQDGPIKEVGVNGITHESLLTILIDRLQCFQEGPYKSHLNAEALYHLTEALGALQQRTKDRIARQVEGTHTV